MCDVLGHAWDKHALASVSADMICRSRGVDRERSCLSLHGCQPLRSTHLPAADDPSTATAMSCRPRPNTLCQGLLGCRRAAFKTRRHSQRVASGLVRSWMTSKLVTSATIAFLREVRNSTQKAVKRPNRTAPSRPHRHQSLLHRRLDVKKSAVSAKDQKFTMQYRL